MAIRDEIESALEELENDLSDSSGATQKLILPSGAEIPCVPAMEDLSTMVMDVGPQAEANIIAVIVRKVHFITSDLTTITVDTELVLADNDTPRPRSGKKPSFRGSTYRFLRSVQDPSGAYFKIFMQGAKTR
jgi:hypothetical protein